MLSNIYHDYSKSYKNMYWAKDIKNHECNKVVKMYWAKSIDVMR